MIKLCSRIYQLYDEARGETTTSCCAIAAAAPAWDSKEYEEEEEAKRELVCGSALLVCVPLPRTSSLSSNNLNANVYSSSSMVLSLTRTENWNLVSLRRQVFRYKIIVTLNSWLFLATTTVRRWGHVEVWYMFMYDSLFLQQVAICNHYDCHGGLLLKVRYYYFYVQ